MLLRIAVLVTASLAAFAAGPTEHRVRERLAEWRAAPADPGPTVRELDPVARLVLYRPTELAITKAMHAGATPEAVIQQRLAGVTMGARDSLRRSHIAGQAAWELVCGPRMSWFLPRRDGALELATDVDPADDAARARATRLLKRLVAGAVPLASTWDDRFEAWRAELVRAGEPTPRDLLAADLARHAIAAGLSPDEPLAAVAERSPAAVADALVHVHPEVRALALAAVLPHLTGPAAAALLDRALGDADLPVRWIAARALVVRDPNGERVARRVAGDDLDRRAATQLLAQLPARARTALFGVLAARAADLPPASQAWLVRAAAAESGGPAAACLTALAQSTSADVARAARAALLDHGDAAAVDAAVASIAADGIAPRDAERALLAIGCFGEARHAKPLDKLLARLDKADASEPLRSLKTALVPLHAYLKGVGKRTPAEECADLAPRLARGEATEWMRARYHRLVALVGVPSAAGVPLATARLPRGGRALAAVVQAVARLESPDDPGRALAQDLFELLHALAPEAFDAPDEPGRALERIGIDLDRPIELLAWRPAASRPFESRAPLSAPFPFAVRGGVADASRALRAMSRSSAGRLLGWDHASWPSPDRFELGGDKGALAFALVPAECGTDLVAASSAALVDDALATWSTHPAPPPSPSTIAALELPLYRWIEQLDPPMILSRSAELAIDGGLTLRARLDVVERRVLGAAELVGIPAPFAALLADAPRERLRAPAVILPGDARAAVVLSLDPAALMGLVRNWPLKWYQKPAGLIAGTQKEAIERWVARIGSECGLALVPVDGRLVPVGFLALSGGDAGLDGMFTKVEGKTIAGGQVWARDGMLARTVGGFLCLAPTEAALAVFGRGPFLADHPGWRERAPKGGAVVGWADLPAIAKSGALPAPLAALGELQVVLSRSGADRLEGEVRHATPLPTGD